MPRYLRKLERRQMLNRLARERELGRTRNLLVAATGTGKTVVAALDYRALCQAQGGQPRLLFVAHRVEILRQAMVTYQRALRAPAFGEVLAEGRSFDKCAASYDHLFASIQSVGAAGLLERFGPDYWHTVVIDECHHLPAQSFDAFARGVRPKFLLGLTATPLRADGKPIAEYFDPRSCSKVSVVLDNYRKYGTIPPRHAAPVEPGSRNRIVEEPSRGEWVRAPSTHPARLPGLADMVDERCRLAAADAFDPRYRAAGDASGARPWRPRR